MRVIHSLRAWLALTENWIHEQILRLPDRIESVVIADEEEGAPPPLNVPVHIATVDDSVRGRLKRRIEALGIPRPSPFKMSLVGRYKPHLIHSHFGNVGWIDRKLARSVGAAHVVTFYGLDVNHLPHVDRRWLERYQQLFQETALILCEGPHMRRSLLEIGAPEHRVAVHHLGVSVESIPFVPKPWDKRSLHVVIASSFRPKKGIPVALEALAKLHRELPIEVTLIGDAGADERSRREKQAILDSIQKHRMPVALRGFVPLAEMREVIQSADIFVAPSRRAEDGDTEGGAPVTLLEVAALGVPIVSTTHCDIPEVILHGETGLLASEGSADSLFKTLREMVERSDDWLLFVQRGRARVEQEFNSSVQATKLASLYDLAVTFQNGRG